MCLARFRSGDTGAQDSVLNLGVYIPGSEGQTVSRNYMRKSTMSGDNCYGGKCNK